jgi:selenocysteine lyase/cysteine desulfurase
MLGFGAAIGVLLEVGVENVWARVESLTDRLCAGLSSRGYRVFSPRGAGQKSGIVTFEPPGMSPTAGPRGRPVEHAGLKKIVAELEKQGIIIVVREGRLRASPHFYNTDEQIDRLIASLP